MPDIGLIIVDPGHFHAALVQQEMYANVSPRVHVYAPLGPDLLDYLNRIARFNHRAERPTRWEVEAHASADFLDRLRHERPGNVAIFSGRNRGKIDRLTTALEAGLHVLADKPIIIRPEDLPVLEAALRRATERRLVFCDMMGGRYEITATLTRLLREDPEVFGEPTPGSAAEPGVVMTSVHHIFKEVAGRPNLRPAWYFDIEEQGEGLTDVGTHMVDRVHRTLFPDQAVDHRAEIRIHSARRWPTMLRRDQFRQVTGEAEWPNYLAGWVKNDSLEYFCNTRLHYEVRGIHATLETRWDWEAPDGGGDTLTAKFRGSGAVLEVRQETREHWRPELYVTPIADICAALEKRISALRESYPGIGLEQRGTEWRVVVPDKLRLGHDAHFIELTRRFLGYVEEPEALPEWEPPNMLTKYFVCVEGVARSRRER
jgi:predicted dehydrogenase